MESYSFYCSNCKISHPNECPPGPKPKAEPLEVINWGGIRPETWFGCSGTARTPLYYCFQPGELMQTVQSAIKENPWIDWAVCNMQDYIAEGLTGNATEIPIWHKGSTLLLEPDKYMPEGRLLVSKKAP